MTGNINPIIGLIVLPTRVIASPILGMKEARTQFTVTIRNVIITLYFFDILSYLKNNSSIVSFEGRTHNGAAAITEKSKEKFPI